jgi:polar amino acid transport system substrate-binding protein
MTTRKSILKTKRSVAKTGLAVGLAVISGLATGQALAAGRTVAEIKTAGELRVGDEASYVPFAFRKDGAIVGYDIDVTNEFCKDLQVKCTLVDTVWAGIIPALLADKFDIIMGQLDYSPERMAKVGFSIPYTPASQAMLVRAADSNTIKSLDDLSGKVLGVKLGSPGAQNKDAINKQIEKDTGKALADIKTFDDHPAAYLALADGRVDGVLNSLTTLAVLIKDQPGQFAVVPKIGSDNWAGVATQLGDSDLTGFLNKEILRMKADGTLAKLQVKWFGMAMPLPDTIPALP